MLRALLIAEHHNRESIAASGMKLFRQVDEVNPLTVRVSRITLRR